MWQRLWSGLGCQCHSIGSLICMTPSLHDSMIVFTVKPLSTQNSVFPWLQVRTGEDYSMKGWIKFIHFSSGARSNSEWDWSCPCGRIAPKWHNLSHLHTNPDSVWHFQLTFMLRLCGISLSKQKVAEGEKRTWAKEVSELINIFSSTEKTTFFHHSMLHLLPCGFSEFTASNSAAYLTPRNSSLDRLCSGWDLIIVSMIQIVTIFSDIQHPPI